MVWGKGLFYRGPMMRSPFPLRYQQKERERERQRERERKRKRGGVEGGPEHIERGVRGMGRELTEGRG